ncbi:MAG: LapA family protein [Dongiaceae bacterium]
MPYATSFSLSLLIVLMVVIGYALGRLLGWAVLRRWRKENKRLRRQLDQPPGSKW